MQHIVGRYKIQAANAKLNSLMNMEILDAKSDKSWNDFNDLASMEVIAEKMVDATYSCKMQNTVF